MMTPCSAETLLNDETPRLDRSSSTSSMDSWVTDMPVSPIEKVGCRSKKLDCSRPLTSSHLIGGSTSSAQISAQAFQQNKDADSFQRRYYANRPLSVRTVRANSNQNASDSYLIGNHDKDPIATLHLGMRSANPSSQRLLYTVGKPQAQQMQSPVHRESPSWINPKFSSRNASSLPPTRSKSGRIFDGSDASQVDQTERVKTKLMSVWNNMKYGWTVRMKTNFSYLSPIWLLGQCYHEKLHSSDGGVLERGNSSMEHFKLDFRSRIWLTYRREFPALIGSTLTTDCGWGCMLRSGQMMLAQALVCHFLGRSWRSVGVAQTPTTETLHRMIIRWFGDDPSSICPFSLHRLVATGESSGKKAGDWYGPASVAFILKQALEKASEENPMLDKVGVYIAQDCTVYKSDVIELCTAPQRVRKFPDQDLKPSPRAEPTSPSLSRTWSNPQLATKMEELTLRWRGAIILVPVRLGGDRLNPIYVPCIQALLSHESCIGIIGGRPKHSLYFVGFQEDRLIHLDPHFCQQSMDVRPADFQVDSFHCSIPRKVAFAKMDPSCTIGFYFRTREDFEIFTEFIVPALIPPNQKSDYPIFVISSGSSLEASSVSSGMPLEDDATADGGSSDFESEDFVLL